MSPSKTILPLKAVENTRIQKPREAKQSGPQPLTLAKQVSSLSNGVRQKRVEETANPLPQKHAQETDDARLNAATQRKQVSRKVLNGRRKTSDKTSDDNQQQPRITDFARIRKRRPDSDDQSVAKKPKAQSSTTVNGPMSKGSLSTSHAGETTVRDRASQQKTASQTPEKSSFLPRIPLKNKKLDSGTTVEKPTKSKDVQPRQSIDDSSKQGSPIIVSKEKKSSSKDASKTVKTSEGQTVKKKGIKISSKSPKLKLKSKSTPDSESKSPSDKTAPMSASAKKSKAVKLPANQKTLERPGKFTMIKKNIYKTDFKVPTWKKDEVMVCMCQPSDTCGEQCMNRLCLTECTRGFCPCEDRCTNQRFQKNEYASLEIFKTENRGWGARARHAVKAGTFVVEYQGEVIDDTEVLRRLEEYTGKDFYMMSLDSGLMIDARVKANLARFLNHSCDPNCATEKWVVNGLTRVGIFAIREIKDGEELTYDYQYEDHASNQQACFCGSSKCRKTLHLDSKTA